MRLLDPLTGGTYDRMERWTTALATGGFGSSGRNAGRGIESSETQIMSTNGWRTKC